ncbi:MAG: hypothetical protein V1781_04990, partial [Bacteroidota bacterium]
MKTLTKQSSLIIAVLTFHFSLFTFHSFAQCDIGSLSGTCTVNTAKTVPNNSTLYTGSGNLIIASGGSITTTNPTDSFIVNMGGNVTINSGGTITGNVRIMASNITVSGSINVNEKGYAVATGIGAGNSISGYSGAGGAGYGGFGGNGVVSSSCEVLLGGTGYGSLISPVDLGSGGGSNIFTDCWGGSGGGKIKLVSANTITINGGATLSANGKDGYNSNAGGGGGGGAGGSIYICTNALSGAGSITSNGGNGAGNLGGGGGGGGRIAIYYSTNTLSGIVTAYGGSRGGYNSDCGNNNSQYGGIGTVYYKQSSQSNGDLILNSGGNTAEYQLAAGVFNSPIDVLTFNNVTISNWVNVGRGYDVATGIGAGNSISGYSGAGGAGYGGIGGNGEDGGAGGATYGSLTDPIDLGSGGGSNIFTDCWGGSGGGKISLISANTIIISGGATLSANGKNGYNSNAGGGGGGGAGGSIYICTNALSGSGNIVSNGGNGAGNQPGGGGGGGRIAIYGINTLSGTVTVNGGTGYNSGNVGTIYSSTPICAILPIELLSFNATAQKDKTVKTQWTTASEIDNDYFTVESAVAPSPNGEGWGEVGTVKGAGNSNTTLNYVFNDEHPYTGVSYYRLKQTDYDGKITYSQIVAVYIGAIDIISIYPNPSTDGHIQYLIGSENGETVTVKLYDMLGREV